MDRGFTLLELAIAIFIITLLAVVGFGLYERAVEKGRLAEAKDTLSQIRTAQEGYRHEYGSFSGSIGTLGLGVPTSCMNTHYFSYSTSGSAATATRCTAEGKRPDYKETPYTVTIDYENGSWSQTLP